MDKKLIDLSICIPTFNRAPFLDYLLENIYANRVDFKFTFEVIISDNASTDHTASIIKKWKDYLPIKDYQQETNIGGADNVGFVFNKASSIFTVYVADDDLIDMRKLNDCIEQFKRMPSVGIFYTPWQLGNPDSKNNKLFYYLDNDKLITKKSYYDLLGTILKHHIFPEIAIFRTSVYKKMDPVFRNNIAFYFFTLVSDWVTIADVYFSKSSFYISVINHPKGNREQAGNEEVQYAWDSYRGGLEVILGKCNELIGDATRKQLLEAINEFIAIRISIAIRLRIASKKDNIETYLLASRLRGLGNEKRLPVPLNVIRTKAVFSYIFKKTLILERNKLLVLLGDFPDQIEIFLRKEYSINKIKVSSNIPKNMSNSVILYAANFEGNNFQHLNVDNQNNIYFSETFLMNSKFS